MILLLPLTSLSFFIISSNFLDFSKLWYSLFFVQLIISFLIFMMNRDITFHQIKKICASKIILPLPIIILSFSSSNYKRSQSYICFFLRRRTWFWLQYWSDWDEHVIWNILRNWNSTHHRSVQFQIGYRH